MIKYLNPFKIFNDIEDGKTYIKPFGLLFSILVIIIDIIIVSILETVLIDVFTTFYSKNTLTFNILLFLLQSFVALISLNLIIFICKKKSPDTNYSANPYSLDFLYVILLILGFRLIYEGSIYQFSNLLTIDLKFNSLLLSCIYAPFIEELLYRGIILNGLIKKYNPVIAIIISSLLFSVMHFNFFQSINAFFIAVIIGYIFHKTKSLYLCIFLHFCNNILALYLPSIVFDNILVHFIYTLFNIILGAFLIIFSINNMKLKKREKIFVNNKEDLNFFLDKIYE